MKMLLYDPDYVSYSIDVFREFLVPEFSKRVDQLIWLAPKSRHAEFQGWISNECLIILVDLEYSRYHPMRWLSALSRRILAYLPIRYGWLASSITEQLMQHRLLDIAKSNNVDIIFCLAFMNQVIPNNSLPVSGILHDLSPDLPRYSLKNIKKLIKRASPIFCVSRFTRASICSLIRPKSSRVVHVVPPSPRVLVKLNRAQINCTQHTRESAFKRQCPLRCFVPATLQERKGHRVLLEAAILAVAQDAQVALTFVGSGTELLLAGNQPVSSYQNSLRNLLRSFQSQGGAWEALGHVDEQHFSTLLDQSDVVVFPSFYEGFGLPVSEAVMAGLPVIASDLLPIREQLDLFECHERVMLVPPGNPEALASALNTFSLGNGPPRVAPEELAKNFEQWTWSMAGESIINHLTSTLAR